MATKKCNGRCGKAKPLSEFSKDPSKSDGLRYECRKCCNEAQRRRRAADPGAAKRYVRKFQLPYRYGITLEEYARMHNEQNGVCAVCGKPETQIAKGTLCELAVDHVRGTRDIRGLLCGKHNRGLGYFDHDPALLRAAADYLDSSAMRIKAAATES